jgi:hypothetical protein
MTDIDRAISRLFVPDGEGFNHFPFGFKRPGYRADERLVEEAVRVERGGSNQALIGVGLVAVLLYGLLPKLAEVHPGLAPLANSPIIRLALAVPLLAMIYLGVMIRRRRLMAGLLAGRAATCPPLAPSAVLCHRAQYWRTTPWYSRLAMFLAIPLIALVLMFYAAARAAGGDGLGAWEAVLAAGFAVALVGLYGFLVYRVMSFRRARSDKK